MTRRARGGAIVVLAVVALLAIAVACALSAPPAEATLAAAADGEQRIGDALARAEAAPHDAAAQVDAAAALLQAADLRLQRAVGVWLAAHPGATLAQVLDADDQVPDDVRTAIVSLCTRGLALAERADASASTQRRARLLQALHVSLLAWANGPARALLAGYGPRAVRAIDAAVAAARTDEAADGAGALRLAGRFRDRAPWPYGDRELAERTLARAVELAPVVANLLFHGDVLARSQRAADAEAAWRAAATAPADPLGEWSAELLREQARARLRAPR